VRLVPSEGSDKKRCSSAVTPQSLLATFESSSPSSIDMPSSSPSSFSRVIGLWAGCSLRLAHMVSACMAVKSLLKICPVNGWYLVCFCIMRLRLAHVISEKTYLPAYSLPNLSSNSTFSCRVVNHLHGCNSISDSCPNVFKHDVLHPLGQLQNPFSQVLPNAHPFSSQGGVPTEAFQCLDFNTQR